MSKKIVIGMILLLFGLHSNFTFAQLKFEKESRMNLKNVPSKAKTFIKNLNSDTKVKWYLEEGLEFKTIEAKFKENGEKYSVEFDTLGNLEDIEIQIGWKELPQSVIDSINSQLAKKCLKYKIQKIQIQYTGNQEALLNKIKTNKTSDNYIIKYEIIINCKTENEQALYEYLFSDAGLILNSNKIVLKNSSNIEY